MNIAFAVSPIGLFVIGVTALAAGAVFLAENWDTVAEVFSKVEEVFSKVFNMISKSELIKSITEGIDILVNKVKSIGNAFIFVWKKLQPIIKAFATIANIKNVVSNLLSKGLDAIGLEDVKPSTLIETVKTQQREGLELIQATTRQLESTFKGRLDIAGAPEGSTFTPSPGGGNDIDVNLLGSDESVPGV